MGLISEIWEDKLEQMQMKYYEEVNRLKKSIEELKKAGKPAKCNMVRAMYAFSGDPITYGHVNIVERARALFPEVIVGIGVNPDKKYMFSLDERLDMAKRALRKLDGVNVVPFQGLLVDYAKEKGVGVVVKGIRNSVDSEYESLLHWIGETQVHGIETVPLFAEDRLRGVSSSAVKAVEKEHGDLRVFVPSFVAQKLQEKVSEQYIVGLTGEIAAGKSYVTDKFLELGKKHNVQVHNIDLDVVAHQILGQLTEPYYVEIRKKLAGRFGDGILGADGFVERSALGKIVFNDKEALKDLDKIMYEAMLLRTRREREGKKGLLFVNGALLAEANWTYLCNNNVVLIGCNAESQMRRLGERKSEGVSLTEEQIKRRIASQYNFAKKKEIIQKKIEEDDNGQIIELDNSDNSPKENIENAFLKVLDVMGVKK
jgi:pantetheine-phosphate adenylyltransferase